MTSQVIAFDPNQTKDEYCVHLVTQDKITLQIPDQPQIFFKTNNNCLSYHHFSRKHSFNPLNSNVINAEYSIKKEFQNSSCYQLLFDALMPNGKRLILIKDKAHNPKKTIPVFLIYEPENKKPALGIFLPNGLLQVAILENKSTGLSSDIEISHAFKSHSNSSFEIEFIRKEIVPFDMELQRSENNPFYIKKYCDWQNQIHLFFRIKPKDGLNLIKLQNENPSKLYFKGPDIVIGDKRKIKINTMCLIPTKKPFYPLQKDKIDIMFSQDRENSLKLESQFYGARDKIDIPTDKTSPVTLSINNHMDNKMSGSNPVEIENSMIIEVCRNNLNDKSMKKSIFCVDPTKDSNFKPTYLDPRIVNDFFFERILITPTKEKEFTVGVYCNSASIRKILVKVNGKISTETTTKTPIRSNTTVYQNRNDWRYQRPSNKKPMISSHVQLVKVEDDDHLIERGKWKSLFT